MRPEHRCDVHLEHHGERLVEVLPADVEAIRAAAVRLFAGETIEARMVRGRQLRVRLAPDGRCVVELEDHAMSSGWVERHRTNVHDALVKAYGMIDCWQEAHRAFGGTKR